MENQPRIILQNTRALQGMTAVYNVAYRPHEAVKMFSNRTQFCEAIEFKQFIKKSSVKTEPKSGNIIPKSGTIIPKFGTIIPKNGNIDPKSGTTSPYNGHDKKTYENGECLWSQYF